MYLEQNLVDVSLTKIKLLLVVCVISYDGFVVVALVSKKPDHKGAIPAGLS